MDSPPRSLLTLSFPTIVFAHFVLSIHPSEVLCACTLLFARVCCLKCPMFIHRMDLKRSRRACMQAWGLCLSPLCSFCLCLSLPQYFSAPAILLLSFFLSLALPAFVQQHFIETFCVLRLLCLSFPRKSPLSTSFVFLLVFFCNCNTIYNRTWEQVQE